MDRKHLSAIRRILTKHKVRKASLFGSAARGEDKRGSDVDIVIQPPPAFTLFGLARLGAELESALGRRVDIITFRSIGPSLKKHILKDLRTIL